MTPQDSSTPGSNVTTQQHDWDIPGRLPDKPSTWDHGYVINRQLVGTTRDELSEVFVKNGSKISLVWTPENPQPVFPEQVPFLVDAFRRGLVREARHALLLGIGFIVVGVLVAVVVQDWTLIYRN